MPRSPVRPSPPDPSKIASRKPGAVHVAVVDRLEHDAHEPGLGLVSRGEGNTEAGADQGEDALFAGGMRPEADAIPEERGVELSRRLALLPTLNQHDLLPQIVPANGGSPCERVRGRKHCDQPLLVKWHARDTRPQGPLRRENDVQVPPLDTRYEIAIAQLSHGQNDLRIPRPPTGQQAHEPYADRR